jgi:hypothetical protein
LLRSSIPIDGKFSLKNRGYNYWQYTTRNSFNTNGLTDRIFLSVIYGCNYRGNFFHPSFRRYIPADYFGWYLPTEWQTKYLELEKKSGSLTWKFCGWFYRRNHRGIQTGIFVQWHVLFTVRMADGIVPSVKLWILAVIIFFSCLNLDTKFYNSTCKYSILYLLFNALCSWFIIL